MPSEITLPIEGVLILLALFVAIAALALISYAAWRTLMVAMLDRDLYVESHTGECDAPAAALRGRRLPPATPPEFR